MSEQQRDDKGRFKKIYSVNKEIINLEKSLESARAEKEQLMNEAKAIAKFLNEFDSNFQIYDWKMTKNNILTRNCYVACSAFKFPALITKQKLFCTGFLKNSKKTFFCFDERTNLQDRINFINAVEELNLQAQFASCKYCDFNNLQIALHEI